MTKFAIDTIKQSITPAQAIEYYTGQRGYHGRYICPFHNDKHPSLSIKGDKWTCWACGEHGDVIDFVRKYAGVGFRDAVSKLAADFNIPVEVIPAASEADRERAMWDRIAMECDRENRRQINAAISERLDKLTTCHRVLAQRNAPKAVLDRYAAAIDNLISEDANK